MRSRVVPRIAAKIAARVQGARDGPNRPLTNLSLSPDATNSHPNSHISSVCQIPLRAVNVRSLCTCGEQTSPFAPCDRKFPSRQVTRGKIETDITMVGALKSFCPMCQTWPQSRISTWDYLVISLRWGVREGPACVPCFVLSGEGLIGADS